MSTVPSGAAAFPVSIADVRRRQSGRTVAQRPIADSGNWNDAAGGGRKEGLGRFHQFFRLEIGCLRLDAHFRGEIEYRAAGDSFEQVDTGRE